MSQVSAVIGVGSIVDPCRMAARPNISFWPILDSLTKPEPPLARAAILSATDNGGTTINGVAGDAPLTIKRCMTPYSGRETAVACLQKMIVRTGLAS